jgi:hypothetical protein
MSRGYLVLAQNNSNVDYLKQAYCLALTIKATQPTINNVSLVTDVIDAVPQHYKSVFDNIISIPWYDDAYNSEWKIENRWKLYHISPYNETIVLDSDMIFLTNIEHWWKYLSKNHEIFVTSSVLTYRNEVVTNDYYRKTFTANSLPNAYSALTYFKQSANSEKFWKLVEVICKDWQMFYQTFLTSYKPTYLSIDVAFAIAIKILGNENEVFSTLKYPTFVHMKGRIQNWKDSSDKWTDCVGYYYNNNGELKIGNYIQRGIFHYTEKDIVDTFLHIAERRIKNGSI